MRSRTWSTASSRECEGDVAALLRVMRATDGAELPGNTTGHGPPLVLCHGGPGLVDYLGPVAAMIADLATVHRYDQRRTGPHTVARYVEDLEELRTYFGYDRWTVGGHSWGATLALCHALEHADRVTGLLYLNGTGLGRAWKPENDREEERRLTLHEHERQLFLKAAARTPGEDREYRILCAIPDFADRLNAPALATALVDAQPTPNYEANRALSEELKTWDEDELVERCHDLDLPVLVIGSELDPRPTWAVDSMVDALPDVHRVELPGVGHLPWLEAPEVLRDVLRAGLPRLQAPG
ncbi:MAG: alpha/beta fold hydrolase [Egibacteraceae bacterium]